MKLYDSYSIKNQALENLQANKNWKAILGNSVIDSVFSAFSEEAAEIVRYAEYLFLESKWETSQDFQQISATSNIVGYTPKRKVSASGTLYISHSNLIHELGRTLSINDFNNISNTKLWSQNTFKVSFTKNATVLDEKGNSYILTSISPLEAGSYFTTNTFMEGVPRIVQIPANIVRDTVQRSKLNPYAYIPVKLPNCENAGTSKTAGFLKVNVITSAGTLEYRIVDSLLLSNNGDRDVEIVPDLYTSDLFYLKFNMDPARGKVISFSKADSSFEKVEVKYVESKGADGNIFNALQRFTVTTSEGQTLYGITLDSITGGANVETIDTIKKNAPKHYLTTYTTATKSSYEEVIKRIDFGSETFADNVKIYAGKDENGDTVVFANIISSELEGRLQTGEITEDKINSILNLSLNSFKAPSDTLLYKSPNYERVSLGVKCTVPRGTVENISSLNSSLQNHLDSLIGSNSLLDFGRDIYDADLIKTIKNLAPTILSVKTELEAVDKLEWTNATRQSPKADDEATIKTIRIPFDFSKIFTGSRYTFKDFKNGADLSLRLDFFFKGSTALVDTYHSTLLLKESTSRANEKFIIIKDSRNIWYTGEDDLSSLSSNNYAFIDPTSPGTILSDIDVIDPTYVKQYPLIEKVLSDDEYSNLMINSSLPELTDNLPGYISDLLIYFSGDNDLTERIGSGYIELGLDSIYNVLQIYSLKDPGNLKTQLSKYPLANLKCSVDENVINGFITDVLLPYVEVYASFRLYEKDLVITDQSFDPGAVIFVETVDPSNTTTNLTEVKKNRFLHVECETV